MKKSKVSVISWMEEAINREIDKQEKEGWQAVNISFSGYNHLAAILFQKTLRKEETK